MGCSASKIPGKIELYYMAASAPCRSVMLTAHALGIKLILKPTNVMAGEHLKPEFLKMNPAHTIPTLNDEGFYLWESRAICTYLVNMYGKDDTLYPKDPRRRAVVDARLDLDQGSIWPRIYDTMMAMMSGGAPSEDSLKKRHDAFSLLDSLLASHAWAAGDHITVADFALVTSLSTAQAVGLDLSQYPHMLKWLAKAKTSMSGYKECNQDGLDMLLTLVKQMQENKSHQEQHQEKHEEKQEKHEEKQEKHEEKQDNSKAD